MRVTLTATASDRVVRAIGAGATSLLDGLGAITWYRHKRAQTDMLPYRFADLYVGDRHVQVSVSPRGRSTRVFVDGVEV